VLLDFANTTGDTIFDHTLREGLSVQLEQSPFLNLLSEQKTRETLKMMRQPEETPLSLEVGRCPSSEALRPAWPKGQATV